MKNMMITDQLNVTARLNELRSLPKGWYDGKGEPLSEDGISRLINLFKSNYPNDVQPPYLFSTPEGKVLAEWEFKPWSLSLEIELSTMQADWHEFNLNTDSETSATFDLNSPHDWRELAAKISSKSESNQ